MLYNYNGFSYFIERNENEVDRSYEMRYWYIVNLTPKTVKEFKEAVKLSKLFVNHKLLNVEYHPNVNSLFLKKIPLCF